MVAKVGEGGASFDRRRMAMAKVIGIVIDEAVDAVDAVPV